MELRFIKTSPTENMTLLIETPVPREQHLEVAEKLISWEMLYYTDDTSGPGAAKLREFFRQSYEAYTGK